MGRLGGQRYVAQAPSIAIQIELLVTKNLLLCAGWAVVSMQWGAWAGSGMAVTHNLLPRIIKSGMRNPTTRNCYPRKNAILQE